MKNILLRLKRALGEFRRTLLYYHIWPYFFNRAAKQPVDEKKALLIAGNFSSLPDNLIRIRDELVSRGINCVEFFSPEGAGLSGKLNEFKRNI